VAKETVTQRVTKALTEIVMTSKPRRNSEGMLFEIRKWQEAKALADRKLKAAWEAAEAEGLVSSDDELRKLAVGSAHIVAESGRFSATAQVAEGGEYLDPERLAHFIARRFKVSSERAARVVKDAKVRTKSRLTKRVLEAGTDAGES